MSGTALFILAAAGLILSAMFIVGLAAALVFHVLGLLMGSVFFLLVTCIYCGSIAWAWRDAQARGRPGWAAALLVAAAFWPLSLLVWILFRPDKKSGAAAAAAEISPPGTPPVIT